MSLEGGKAAKDQLAYSGVGGLSIVNKSHLICHPHTHKKKHRKSELHMISKVNTTQKKP